MFLNSARLASLAVLVAAFCLWPEVKICAQSSGAIINPLSFPSLGPFNPGGDVVIDVQSGQMSGGASFAGVTSTQAGAQLLVFCFSSVTLNAGVTVTVDFDSPTTFAVALLSRGDATINGVIEANGTVGGAGPFGTGLGAGSNGGAGVYGGGGGGGAGYGGQGGSGQGGSTGGGTYDPDATERIDGGSGGGAGGESGGGPGGSGGGALQMASLGALNVNGTISANGGAGAKGQAQGTTTGGSGGGGSGGGILLQAANVTLSSGATVSATGGNGGPEYIAPTGTFNLGEGGGGGGGGRIVFTYLLSGNADGFINVGGGNSGYGFSGNGSPGSVEFVQSTLVPATPSLAASRGPSGEIVLSWPSYATNYALETSAVLGAGATWSAVHGAVVSGNNFVLTYPAPAASGFFRLEAP